MTKYNEFLASDELVRSWRDTLATNETLRMVLEAMESVAPIALPLPKEARETPHGLIDHGGYTRGFAEYQKKLYALAVLPEPTLNLETTYGTTEENEN